MAQPDFIPRPFAENGDKDTIQDTTTVAGQASWSVGFPPITSTPPAQGGIAPTRPNFNGIFNALSQFAFYFQQGGIMSYSNTQDYEPPAWVYDETDDAYYFCIQANGVSSTVISPHDDTTGAYWARLDLGITEATKWIPSPIPTRVSDNQISFTGDVSDTYPMGKLLRFQADDNYSCRVLGEPSVSGGTTTLTLWFDNATYKVPTSITTFERSRNTPQADARGVELITENTYTDEELETLLKSYCYSAISWEED